MAHKSHPDRNANDPNATKVMQSINEAYDVLSDSTRRAEYDAALNAPETTPQAQPAEAHYPPPSASGNKFQFLVLLLAAALGFILLSFAFNHSAPPPAAALPVTMPAPLQAAPEATPEKLANCTFSAAKNFAVPPPLLLAILSAEDGSAGDEIPAAGGSRDLGLMRINSAL